MSSFAIKKNFMGNDGHFAIHTNQMILSGAKELMRSMPSRDCYSGKTRHVCIFDALTSKYHLKRLKIETTSGGSWLLLMVGPAKQLLKCQKVPFVDYLNLKAGKINF